MTVETVETSSIERSYGRVLEPRIGNEIKETEDEIAKKKVAIVKQSHVAFVYIRLSISSVFRSSNCYCRWKAESEITKYVDYCEYLRGISAGDLKDFGNENQYRHKLKDNHEKL